MRDVPEDPGCEIQYEEATRAHLLFNLGRHGQYEFLIIHQNTYFSRNSHLSQHIEQEMDDARMQEDGRYESTQRLSI